MKPSEPTSKRKLHRREQFFIAALLVAMTVATGPGVLLVNRPETVFGFPIIYAWGVAWYVIIAGLAVAADCLVWKKDAESLGSASGKGEEAEGAN